MPKKKTEVAKKVAKESVKKAVKKTKGSSKTMAVKKVATKKKAASKSTVKKTATKAKVSRRTKATDKKDLVFSSNDNSFWVTDGQVLNSLLALNEALNDMDKEVYSYHVTKDKHDFADWVEMVLVDMPCATELRKAKSPNSACRVVAKYLRFYNV